MENNNIVPTNEIYNYYILKQNLEILNKTFPFLNIQTVGKSVLDNDIDVVKLGTGPKKVFYAASFHSNEWITSVVLMKFIEDYCNSFINNSKLYGYSVKQLFSSCSIYIMPMVNPDGVNLVTNSLDKNSISFLNAKKIANSFPNISFPDGWKANINGVDLNLQFPAKWLTARDIKYKQGFIKPAPRDFVGYGPLTEPEAIAIYDFTISHNFNLVIAFHTQGKEIYWQFSDYMPPKSWFIGNKFAVSSGYTLTDTPYNSSFAGFKDWFIQDYNRPGYTIEAGFGVSPLPISQFDEIYKDISGILILGAVL